LSETIGDVLYYYSIQIFPT